jgi:hypothetical protein
MYEIANMIVASQFSSLENGINDDAVVHVSMVLAYIISLCEILCILISF